MMPFNVSGYIMKEWPLGGDSITCSIQAFVYFCYWFHIHTSRELPVVAYHWICYEIDQSCGYTSVVCLLAITVNRFIIIIYRDVYVQVFSRKNVSSQRAIVEYKFCSGLNLIHLLLVDCSNVYVSITARSRRQFRSICCLE